MKTVIIFAGYLCAKLSVYDCALTDRQPSPNTYSTILFADSKPIILGFRLNDEESLTDSAGALTVLPEQDVDLRVFGINFQPSMLLSFSQTSEDCNINLQFRPKTGSVSGNTAVFAVKFPHNEDDQVDKYRLCTKIPADGNWTSQNSEPWLQVHVHPDPKPREYLMPLWLQIFVIVSLLTLAGLFSGLNLGLLSLDPTELKIDLNCGTPRIRRYARAIIPLRKHGNFLLCTLLLGNVLVNSTLTILIDDLTSGPVALVVSTFVIVIFGEIVPQAICTRHGMAVGANTVLLTRFFMLITGPLSYPISKVLDWILGAEAGRVYNREHLVELLRVTHGLSDLEKDEINIISGVLRLKQVTAGEIMTPLEDVFMINYDAVLDAGTVSNFVQQGFTRIPVYDDTRSNIVAVLNIKDLTMLDYRNKTPVKILCKFFQRHVITVNDNTSLDKILDHCRRKLRRFHRGNRGHCDIGRCTGRVATVADQRRSSSGGTAVSFLSTPSSRSLPAIIRHAVIKQYSQ
ncbi:unextended protein-like isoform X2 [Paramacrobiotus metropolitanus]|uniref:unextended protein-like isoform X2 n=1 Tax=Paramacrobiotus metropolitanus TaxID=2943436 RepID=UPI00244629A9|nr:unextended protein-like isoform X2 [Paramacrobiotus metropolitanus]